jgi:polar amino acid transport system ATP-binding protein
MTVSTPTAAAGTPLRRATALDVRSVSKTFGARTVLDGVDLTVSTGEVVALIGPSGSGKSTLLRCMNVLEQPTGGDVEVLGTQVVTGGKVVLSRANLQRLRARVGMVFQSFNLFPTMTAEENVTFAQVHTLGRSRAAATDRSRNLLEQVGLGHVSGNLPSQLSGGQQQRVAIARALAMDAEVMLFDEPTSAIDPELRVEVLKVMRDLAEGGMTMVVVTHELRFAERVADRVAFLAEGRILECSPPAELFSAPGQERTRRFLAAIGETEL